MKMMFSMMSRGGGGQGAMGMMFKMFAGGGAGGGAGAAAGGAAAGGAMAALGPLAMALGPAILAIKAIDAAGDALQKTFTDLGKAGAAIVSGNFWGMFRGGAEKASDALTMIFPLGGLVSKAFLGIADAGKMLTDAFMSEAKRLSSFSGQIGVAQAQADVRDIMMSFREANALGGGLAQLTSQQSQIDVALREAFLPLKEALLTDVNSLVEVVADIANFLKENKEGIKSVYKFVGGATMALVDTARFIAWMLDYRNWMKLLGDNIAESAKFWKDKEKAEDESLALLNQLIGATDLFNDAAFKIDPVRPFGGDGRPGGPPPIG